MTMLTATIQRRGNRLPQLSPFDPEAFDPAPAPKARQPESAYGCVEWFHYLAPPIAPVPHGARRRRRLP
jgi:hypothetical protein